MSVTKTSMFIIVCNFSLALFAETKSSQFLSSRELHLGSYQQEILEEDLPISDFINDGKDIWLLGRSSLWVWNLKNNKLYEIRLIISNDKTQEVLKHLVKFGKDDLFAASDSRLYRISFNPKKVLVYEVKNNDLQDQSYGIFEDQNDIYWVKKNGIWKTQEKLNTLTFWKKHPTLKNNDQVIFSSHRDHQKIWLINQNKFSTFDYQNENNQFEQHLKIQVPFISLKKVNNKIVLYTKKTVLILTPSGELLKTIPVGEQRKLILASYNNYEHSYLFNDRYLEIFKNDQKNHYFSRLDLGRVQNATLMASHNSYHAFILDGKPRIFQLEQK